MAVATVVLILGAVAPLRFRGGVATVIVAIVDMDTNRRETHLPLAAAAFSILLALTGGDKHGYAIMREIGQSGDAGLRIGPATLYRSIKQLREADLIEESGDREDLALDDQRRRYYRLTEQGRRVVQAEARRLADLVAKAANQGLLPRRLGAVQ
jgi:DNA-binding PadR family transcriptional regulator